MLTILKVVEIKKTPKTWLSNSAFTSTDSLCRNSYCLSLTLRDASDDSPHFLEQGGATFYSSLHRRKGQINGLFMQTVPVVLTTMMGSKYCTANSIFFWYIVIVL
jgi:hypothetical protein